jgi:hypothetical protein
MENEQEIDRIYEMRDQQLREEQQQLDEQLRFEFSVLTKIFNTNYTYENVFANAQQHYNRSVWYPQMRHIDYANFVNKSKTFTDNLFEEHPEFIHELQGLKNLQDICSCTHDEYWTVGDDPKTCNAIVDNVYAVQQKYFELTLKPEYFYLYPHQTLK